MNGNGFERKRSWPGRNNIYNLCRIFEANCAHLSQDSRYWKPASLNKNIKICPYVSLLSGSVSFKIHTVFSYFKFFLEVTFLILNSDVSTLCEITFYYIVYFVKICNLYFLSLKELKLRLFRTRLIKKWREKRASFMG
jgi:hypothetical protein